jgi:hypothetical protein
MSESQERSVNSAAPVKVMDRGIMTLVGTFVVLGGLGSIIIGVGGLLLKYFLNFFLSQMGGPPPATMAMGREEEILLWVNLVMYVPAGVGLVILGVGTIRCRKWARTLMESLSALMTVVGIVGFFISLIFVVFMPDFIRTLLEDPGSTFANDQIISIILFVSVAILIVGALFYIGIPAVLWWFYRLKSVRALCEMWDPKGSWLDKNPPLVNALVLVNGAGIFLCLPFFVLEFESGAAWPVVPVSLAFLCAALVVAGIGLATMRLWGWLLEMTLAVGLSIAGSWWVMSASTRGLIGWYFGLVGMNFMPALDESAFAVFDMLAHVVIWGSSLPVVYVLLRELRGFLRPHSPKILPVS